MLCPGCTNPLKWADGAYCDDCMAVARARVYGVSKELEKAIEEQAQATRRIAILTKLKIEQDNVPVPELPPTRQVL